MNKGVLFGIIGVVILGGVWFMQRDGTSQEAATVGVDDMVMMATSSDMAATDEMTASSTPDETSTSTPPMPETKEFAVDGDNFKFSLGEMRVKQGDTVRVTFTNTQGKHDWKLDEFKVATKILKQGEKEVVEFVADKTGTFEYYCSVGTHRQMGMKGNLIVE